MQITIETNAPEVAGLVGQLFRDQIPFATSRAVNDVALSFQKSQREHQRSIFTVRRPQFIDRAVKIRPFARKTNPVATVKIEPPGGQARADIITKFETQTKKYPFSGNTIAVPVDVKRTGVGVVSKPWRPKHLNLKHVAGRMSRGDRRTFAIRNAGGGAGAIFRRKGRRGQTEVELLYLLVPDADIEPNLNFVQNARITVSEEFVRRFNERFDEAVKSARSNL